MSKKKSIVVVVSLLLAVTLLIIVSFLCGGSITGFKASSVNLEIGYAEDSDVIATDILFSYDNVKAESEKFQINISDNSKIIVSEFSSSEECTIELCRNNKVFQKESITSDRTIAVEFDEVGVFELVLTMGVGKGEGKIIIE